MAIDVKYTTRAAATGGRDGYAETEDGSFKVDLGVPEALGGDGKGNNPEQLFAAGYAACFLGAMKHVASQEGQTMPDDAKVSATVGIGPRSEGGFGLDVQLDIALPGLTETQAQQLVNHADKVCPYSHATRGNIDVRLNIVQP